MGWGGSAPAHPVQSAVVTCVTWEGNLSYLNPTLSPPPQQKTWLGLSSLAWMSIAVVALLMAALYWPNLRRLWLKTNPITGAEAANWSHSLLVPVIGLYYLYLRRDDLLSATIRPLLVDRFGKSRVIGGGVAFLSGLVGYLFFRSAGEAMVGSTIAGYADAACLGLAALGLLALAFDWGIGSLLAGLLLFAYGIWPGQNDYLKDVGMVITLFGAVLTLCGWQVMRVAWFPILFLICAIPWPGLVYSKVALPLQFLAAEVAVIVLNIAQVDTVVEGTQIIMHLPDRPEPRMLNVAEACAGMRSLMTFITAGAAIGFVFGQRPLWQRLTIVASAVPIAIFCNVMRVSVQGLLDVYVSQQISENFAHAFVGLVMLLPAFFMLLAVGWVLDNLFVEVDDEEPTQPAAPAGRMEASHV